MGYGVDAYLHDGLFLAHVGCAGVDGIQYLGELIAQEYGYDGRGRLAGSKTMVVACGGNGYAQKILIVVNGLYNGAQYKQKLGVLIRSVAGFQQIHAGVGL